MFKTKIKPLLTFKRCVSLLALAALIGLNTMGSLAAQSVTQGYGTDETLQRTRVERIGRDQLRGTETAQECFDRAHQCATDL